MFTTSVTDTEMERSEFINDAIHFDTAEEAGRYCNAHEEVIDANEFVKDQLREMKSLYVIRHKVTGRFVAIPHTGVTFTDDLGRADKYTIEREARMYCNSDEEVVGLEQATEDRERIKRMDPDANLREQLTLAHFLTDSEGVNEGVKRLAELILCMDRWLAEGGPLPVRWQENRK